MLLIPSEIALSGRVHSIELGDVEQITGDIPAAIFSEVALATQFDGTRASGLFRIRASFDTDERVQIFARCSQVTFQSRWPWLETQRRNRECLSMRYVLASQFARLSYTRRRARCHNYPRRPLSWLSPPSAIPRQTWAIHFDWENIKAERAGPTIVATEANKEA